VDKIVVLLQQSIEHMSIVNTCITYFECVELVHVIYLRVSGQCWYTIPG